MIDLKSARIGDLYQLLRDVVTELARRDRVSTDVWEQGVPDPATIPVAPVPAPPVVPVPTPLAPVPAPAPLPPIEAPPDPSGHVVSGVKATIWRNQGDEGVDPAEMASGYLARAGDGHREAWVSLPCPCPSPTAPGRMVRVRIPNQNPPRNWSPPMRQMDSGPWRTKDRYWITGARPEAEAIRGKSVYWSPSRGGWYEDGEKQDRKLTGNGAGIDLTPRAAAMVILGRATGADVDALAMELYLQPRELTVDIEVTEPGVAPAPKRLTREAALERARSLVNAAVTYELGTEPPGDRSDCSGFACWAIGLDRNQLGLNTDAEVRDAVSPGGYLTEVRIDQALPGDLLVYGAGNGHAYGHVGVISSLDVIPLGPTKPETCIDCSSDHPAGRAVQERSADLWLGRGAIVARYRFEGE
jgi:hypothetical protein